MNINYKKWSLILLSWLPWSWKSTFLQKYFKDKNHYIISSDEIRERYFWKHLDYSNLWLYQSLIQENWDTIFWIMKELAKSKLDLWQTCIIDATLLKDKDRNTFINLWEWKEIHIIFFDLSLNTILSQNKQRLYNGERYVPEEIITSKYDSFQRDTQNKSIIKHYISEKNRNDKIIINETIDYIEWDNYDNIYIIWDTHGSPNFINTISELQNQKWKNKIIIVWDLVDKWPNSFENIKFLYELYKTKEIAIDFIMWNHDYRLYKNISEYILNWFETKDMNINGYYLETFNSFISKLNNNDLIKIKDFLKFAFKDFIILNKNNQDYLISHAPFLPPFNIFDINRNDCMFWSSKFRKLYNSWVLNEYFINSLNDYAENNNIKFINWHINYSKIIKWNNIINLDGSVEYDWNITILEIKKNNELKIIEIPSWINIQK